MEDFKQKNCTKCGFSFNCICQQLVNVNSPFNFILLTHENELKRKTNTGKLLLQCFSNSKRIIWKRGMSPLTSSRNMVLFPCDTALPINQESFQTTELDSSTPINLILIDSTWQEAKKILRQTPWLDKLPKVALSQSSRSSYTLRRNQSDGHLCTFEVAIEALNEWGGFESQVCSLKELMVNYQKTFQADRCGHTLRKNKR
jgi:DTW domain-containing protein YfiP